MQNSNSLNKTRKSQTRNLVVELATTHKDVLATQRLRYQIFADEMGAELESSDKKIDEDFYDRYCHHLLVRDLTNQQVVACTRILTCEQAEVACSFYSQHEFDLSGLLPLPGRVMEIGRTCVDQDYRKGGAISVLWSGLAEFMSIHQYDFLMGCASISLQDQGANLNAIMQKVRKKYLSHQSIRVTPRKQVPINSKLIAASPQIPSLLKAYLRLGAKVCGEPNWDKAFNVADVFILLDMDALSPRYHRHFIQRTEKQPLAKTMGKVAAR